MPLVFALILMFGGVVLIVFGCWLLVRGLNDYAEEPELLIVLKKKECEMVCRCIEFAEHHGIADFEEMQLAHNLRQRHGFERKFHA